MQTTASFPDFIPFMDWYGIWAGTVGWPTDGGPCSLQDIPQGVRLSVQQAEQTEPFLRPERPWETGFMNYMQVLYDEGRYRLWYSAAPDWETVQAMNIAPGGSGGYPDFTCYAESDDGFEWTRPNLRMYEFGGSKENNIICEAGITHPNGWHIHTLFKDPTAPSEERYKSVGATAVRFLDDTLLPKMTRPEMQEFIRQMQLEGSTQDEINRRMRLQFQLLGFVSPDGLHWRRLPQPILEPPGRLDMRNMVFYDDESGRYVGYIRGHVGRRRTLRKTTSERFAEGWEEPRQVLMADSQDPPDLDFYDFGYCRRPGGHYHLMFFGAFHRNQDTIDVELAVSLDGDVWTRPERIPIITRDIPGHPGETYGGIWPSPGLFELRDDLWGQPYFTHERTHWDFDYDNWKPRGKGTPYHWALWKRDRLVALEAPVEGRVTLLDRECAGRELLLNFKTEAGGYIRAELINRVAVAQKAETPPLEGYSFGECDPLYGDSLSQPVTWRGRSDLSALKGRNILVRLHMVKANVFAYAV
jgi:hypothetical protein